MIKRKNKKTALVTGGSGFIGRNLISQLLEVGFKVINVSRTKIKDLPVENIMVDLVKTDFKFLKQVNFDYLVHLAALSNNRLCQDIEVAKKHNIDLTFNLFNFLRNHKQLKKIIYLSSSIIYSEKNQNPIKENGTLNIFYNNYSFTKGMAEFWAEYFRKFYQLPILSFRLSNIYGPYQKYQKFPLLVPQIIYQALIDGEIAILNDKPVRDWIFAEDAASAIVLGLKSDYQGVMNLATGEGHSVGEIVEIVAKLTKAKIKILNQPTIGPSYQICDIGLIKRELKWRPRLKLAEGLKKTVDFYRQEIRRT